MKLAKLLATASVAALLSGPALAATASSVKDAPEGTAVTLKGTVQDFDSQHSFMLQDSGGSAKIDLTSVKPMVLKNGEEVTVTGHVHNTILGSDVVADNVSEDKAVGERVGAAIDSITGQDAAGSAKATTIASLPQSGMVKINGTVDSVDSGKKFTLKDSTGHINVTMTSGESASLTKGTQVTVIGNVDKGLLGPSIKATEVDVRSSGDPVAAQ